ncbi:hypothetical protein D5366_11740 (plasmid) [Neokomagataea tanensis]|uniref:Uncharacterized protein n=1 Tax=Neokomagataea tanensis TaxID=661191 RepID=A0A4Y6VC55_9PROT|nr:hypothetical protein D5366_11740 [Neokomagataea tanensis]
MPVFSSLDPFRQPRRRWAVHGRRLRRDRPARSAARTRTDPPLARHSDPVVPPFPVLPLSAGLLSFSLSLLLLCWRLFVCLFPVDVGTRWCHGHDVTRCWLRWLFVTFQNTALLTRSVAHKRVCGLRRRRSLQTPFQRTQRGRAAQGAHPRHHSRAL